MSECVSKVPHSLSCSQSVKSGKEAKRKEVLERNNSRKSFYGLPEYDILCLFSFPTFVFCYLLFIWPP